MQIIVSKREEKGNLWWKIDILEFTEQIERS